MIRRLYNYLPQHILVNNYKFIVRPHWDIIYDNHVNESIYRTIEAVQYSIAVFTITMFSFISLSCTNHVNIIYI